jgi:D-alanyl-lipoteichoic acid acyltransferase DltB (MBOAT superfamily)
MLLYTLQLYADFTGGIDITIGIAQCLGIKVSENFNCPYFSKSLKEYWRRWHITMCSWFRDYVFYPVSTSKPLQNFQRSSHCRKLFGDRLAIRLPVYVASFIVWFCTGLWHGASWNFVVWGLCNWAVLMISEELEPLYSKFHKTFSAGGRKPYQLLRIVRTFLLVCCLNLFDCYATLGETWSMFRSMFTASNWHILLDGSLLCIGLSGIDFIILAAGISLMLGTSLLQRTGSVREKIGQKHYIVRFLLWYGLFLAVLILGAYGVGYDSSQFIYSRF